MRLDHVCIEPRQRARDLPTYPCLFLYAGRETCSNSTFLFFIQNISGVNNLTIFFAGKFTVRYISVVVFVKKKLDIFLLLNVGTMKHTVLERNIKLLLTFITLLDRIQP